MLVSFQAFAQVNVTFSVDMGATPINGTGLHVVGTINGWNTSANELTQVGTSTIYSGVVSIGDAMNPTGKGWHQYKFLNADNWGGVAESPSSPCAPFGNNRLLYINDSGADVALTTPDFGGCSPTGSTTVTFSVDMASETTSANGIHMVGDFNGWNTSNFELTDVTDTTYSSDINLPTASAYELNLVYKYLNGNAWGTPEENLAPLNDTCGSITGNNRNISGLFDGVTTNDVFNACNAVLSTDNLFLSNALIVFYSKERGLVVQSNQVLNAGTLNIEIYDLSGKRLKSSSFMATNSEETILLNSIDKGLYIVNISDEFNHLMVKKIIVN